MSPFFDVYGQLLGSNLADAQTSLLNSGEYTDLVPGQQYLRARYYDASTGRFNRLDPFADDALSPLTLNNYAYANGDPIQFVDPTGNLGVAGVAVGVSIGANLQGLKNSTDLFAFDVAVATVDAIKHEITVSEAIRGFFIDQAVGFGIGFAIGKLFNSFSSLLENGVSVRRASPVDEVASSSFLPIRRGDGALRVHELRRTFNVSSRRNIAFTEVNLGDSVVELRAVSGRRARDGFLPPQDAAFFNYEFDQHFRGFDSEAIILENLAQRMSPDSSGAIRLFTERPPCTSCNGVIEQFQQRFPKVKLVVSHGP